MKINILVPNGGRTAGGGRVIADYANFLASQGHEVVAYVADYGSRIQALTDLAFVSRRFKAKSISHLVPNSPHARHFDGLRRLRVSDIDDGDIVIATWWETAEWMRKLPSSKGKQVHFVQGHEIFPFLPQARTRAVYARPDVKITVSSWLREVIWSEYGLKSKLVLNGVDTNSFYPCRRSSRSSLRLGFLWSKNAVKNMDRAVSAISDVKKVLPSLSVQVFGAEVRPKELPDWIEYESSPTQKRIVEIYSACDAWLFTSDSEGFGLPILEAMACGTPVLATHAGAATDLVIDSVNGRLLPFRADAFRDAILELSEMPISQHVEWVDSARRTAEDHDIVKARKRFEEVLEGVLANS